MNHKNVTMKRLTLYIGGLFFLTLGVSLSIQAGLGVSPVSSLAYALVLTSGLSIGITTVLANILFILVQIILSKRMDIKDLMLQLIISVVFGFFMDATLFLVQLLPTPESIVLRCVYLIISLFVVSAGLIGYFTAKLPLMPYDALTYVISEQFKIKFSKAKITGDLINVFVAAIMGLVFIQSFGAIGIGTIVAAYFIGKILGWMILRFQEPLQQWVSQNEKVIP
ncbi:YczE/YyaS/YitT family protein [Psychrobacillus sp. FSL K6-1464]|uniref:YczE/YyaS/YitT family protein n=1 Tax=Psychrobacillus sp. FSL K6-1464 TaxID=2921545 RepID=UPI0030FCCD97